MKGRHNQDIFENGMTRVEKSKFGLGEEPTVEEEKANVEVE